MKPAEILMEIAVFFVRAVFIAAVVSVLIARAAFAEDFSRQARRGYRP